MKHHEPTPLPSETGLCRRAFLGYGAGAFGALGLGSLLGRVSLAGDAAPRWSNGLPPTAKRVIQIFLNGGMSQLDLFDEKPMLVARRGEEIPESVHRGASIVAATERRGAFPAVGTIYKFKRHGESGLNCSELIPHIAKVADDITVINTMQTDHTLHETAITTLLTGTPLLERPSWGSWVTYALGSDNENLPEFVVLGSNAQGDSPLQPRLWGAGFLPGRHQGVKFRSGSAPVLDLSMPAGVDDEARKSQLAAIDALNKLEAAATNDPDTTTRIQAYEMAARMQTSVPELTDVSKESDEMLEQYGAERGKPSFAGNCLLARRLVERGVRFVQVADGGWDHHGNIPRSLPRKCEQIDQPIGALIADLKDRGLLDDTVVFVTSEFGRTPHCDGPLGYGQYGRDHHSLSGAAIVAGGGFKAGLSYGKTDEWGWNSIENPVHVHDLQATVLHTLGIDHERLTFRHEGRDFRLTDVGGRVVDGVLA